MARAALCIMSESWPAVRKQPVGARSVCSLFSVNVVIYSGEPCKSSITEVRPVLPTQSVVQPRRYDISLQAICLRLTKPSPTRGYS
jgi:hypothetical protein